MTILAVGGARNTTIGGTNATTRAYDLDGNLLWSADHGATVYGVAVGADDAVVSVGNRTSNLTTRKYNSSGNLLWSADHGNTARCVAIDIDGNIYTGGVKYTGVSPNISIRKYDSSGNELWNAVVDSTTVYGIAVDRAGAVYVSASRSSGTLLTVYKFDSAGTAVWSRSYHTSGLYSIAVNSSESVAVCGFTSSSISTLVYDSSGNLLWSVDQGATSAQGIAYDQSGAVYVGGLRNGTSYSSTKHNGLTGAVVWTTYHGWDVNAVAVKKDGSIFFEGGLRTTYLVNPQNATHRKYDGDGTLLWSGDFGGTVYGLALPVEPWSVTGQFYDHAHFLLTTGSVDWDTDTIKAALVTSDYIFDATHTEYSDLGDAVLTTSALTQNISDAYLLAENLTWTALSGSSNALVVYKDDTVGALDRPLLWYQALNNGSSLTWTGQALRFRVGWSTQQAVSL